jgi:manganese transport protein
VTGAVAFAMLGPRRHGHRPFELIIVGMLAVVLLGFVCNAALAGIEPAPALRGTVPHLAGPDTLLLAVGMLGATVMPHAIYLHGGLTSSRHAPELDVHAVMRAQRVDVVVAMVVAGAMNLLLLLVAAAALGGRGIDTIAGAHAGLEGAVGAGASLMFALALLASGLASSSVGTLAGQMVMEGFVRRRVPLAARRLATLLPAVTVLLIGVEPTDALVVSQVVLSFGIPFALVPLVDLTARRSVMGRFVNRRATTIAGAACAAAVIALNCILLVLVA